MVQELAVFDLKVPCIYIYLTCADGPIQRIQFLLQWCIVDWFLGYVGYHRDSQIVTEHLMRNMGTCATAQGSVRALLSTNNHKRKLINHLSHLCCGHPMAGWFNSHQSWRVIQFPGEHGERHSWLSDFIQIFGLSPRRRIPNQSQRTTKMLAEYRGWKTSCTSSFMLLFFCNPLI